MHDHHSDDHDDMGGLHRDLAATGAVIPDGRISGTTRGLNPDGYLIVRKDDGSDTLVLAGGVRAARA